MTVLLVGTALLTSCLNDDKDNHQTIMVYASNGAYVVGSGNQSSNIDGNLTFYNYADSTATKDIFNMANGISLGKSTNDALRYGTKLYIVASGENTIFVCNAKTMKILQRISTTDLLGTDNGTTPRCLTATSGHIFVTTSGGYVGVIDTLQYKLTTRFKAGSYPEGMAIANGYLYVANSDRGNGMNPSISIINLSTGATDSIKNENIRNPQQIAVYGSEVYFLDYGYFDIANDSAQTANGVYRINGSTVTKVCDATAMAVGNGSKIYTYNQPYGADFAEYWVYDAATRGNPTYFTFWGVESPSAIGVDPVTGNIFIASNHTTAGEWAKTDGYVSVYNTGGQELYQFECGINPVRITFSIGVEYVTL